MDLKGRDFLTLKDFTPEEISYLLDLSAELKDKKKKGIPVDTLRGKNVALIFEKTSTRTRCSFEVAAHDLGMGTTYLDPTGSQIGKKESIKDTARVLAGMYEGIEYRGFGQEIVEELAKYSKVPVWNGLTNEYHPCQILADIFTFIEHRGPIQGKTVAWIGDSNNMCNTWLQAAEVLDFTVHVSTPPGYEVESERAGLHGTGHFKQFANPMDAAKDADIVTTDVWTSMGFEAENEARLRDFADWQVDAEMMRVARPDAIFLHCLPAHRGEEVTAEVIDGPQSEVWEEAENRLHVQKALMEYLVLGRVNP